ncbi:MAG: hypothetical protein IKT40_12020 [Bacilli bacterium]|nr:hypothetical protein [Bacilli bacterium]
MDNKSYLINVIALSETFLENNKKKLEGINDFIIKKVGKDNECENIKVTRGKYISTMVDIFENHDLSNLNSIEIYYVTDGISTYLSGIDIY